VIYVVFSEKDEKVYKSLVGEYFPGPPDDSEASPSESEAVDDAEQTEGTHALDDENTTLPPPSSQATVVNEDDDEATVVGDTATAVDIQPVKGGMKCSEDDDAPPAENTRVRVAKNEAADDKEQDDTKKGRQG